MRVRHIIRLQRGQVLGRIGNFGMHSGVVIFGTEYIEMKGNALAKTAKQFKDGMKCGTRYLIHNYYFTHTITNLLKSTIYQYSFIFINIPLYQLTPSCIVP
jgi:hypothetical protein